MAVGWNLSAKLSLLAWGEPPCRDPASAEERRGLRKDGECSRRVELL